MADVIRPNMILLVRAKQSPPAVFAYLNKMGCAQVVQFRDNLFIIEIAPEVYATQKAVLTAMSELFYGEMVDEDVDMEVQCARGPNRRVLRIETPQKP